jgi:hypothetical protein
VGNLLRSGERRRLSTSPISRRGRAVSDAVLVANFIAATSVSAQHARGRLCYESAGRRLRVGDPPYKTMVPAVHQIALRIGIEHLLQFLFAGADLSRPASPNRSA